MSSYHRDAGFAVLCGLVFIAYLIRTGEVDTLRTVPVAVVGVVGALTVEALFVFDTPVTAIWTYRGGRAGSAVALIGSAVGLATLLGPPVVAAACWGLATYFVLLGITLAHQR